MARSVRRRPRTRGPRQSSHRRAVRNKGRNRLRGDEPPAPDRDRSQRTRAQQAVQRALRDAAHEPTRLLDRIQLPVHAHPPFRERAGIYRRSSTSQSGRAAGARSTRVSRVNAAKRADTRLIGTIPHSRDRPLLTLTCAKGVRVRTPTKSTVSVRTLASEDSGHLVAPRESTTMKAALRPRESTAPTPPPA